jgi:3-hydroxyacyl-[acyl-carrier-protein] dehydratase
MPVKNSPTSTQASAVERAAVFARIPQQAPFRFVDELTELGADGARGSYRFREDEYFYAGHFPGRPVTPGVILIETMAQIGLVPLAIFLNDLRQVSSNGAGAAPDAAPRPQNVPGLTLFTEVDEVEFQAPVLPGEIVTVRSEKIFYRHNKLRCRVELCLASGALAACGTLSGIGVPA